MTKAVLFDVDFTLIYPGPTFQGEGYKAFCARYGIDVDASLFDQARAAASSLLDATAATSVYDNDVYVDFTRRIIEGMGGQGEAMTDCAREIYAEWAACHHFSLYDEVPAALSALVADGVRIGLVSNSHRCLSTFQSHFGLEGLIDATISSSEHGLMKPHPSIFIEALRRLGVDAADSVMVGDSVSHDVEGGLRAGMGAVLLHRDESRHPLEDTLSARGVPTIRTLHELPAVLRLRQPELSPR